MQAIAFSQNDKDENLDSSRPFEDSKVIDALHDLKGEHLFSCFRGPKEESHIESVKKLAEATTPIGDFVVPLIKMPSIKHRLNRMVSLQQWEGYVLQILKDSIWVRLVDLTHRGPDEETEIPFEEIEQEDRKLIRPGAVFYWNIGYLDLYSGQRLRVSIIRFQRLPAWRKEEINGARKEAERLQSIIKWE
jgi:hypothetical protein